MMRILLALLAFIYPAQDISYTSPLLQMEAGNVVVLTHRVSAPTYTVRVTANEQIYKFYNVRVGQRLVAGVARVTLTEKLRVRIAAKGTLEIQLSISE